jgi:hypothetical protein
MNMDEHSFLGMLYHHTQIVILTLQKNFILFQFPLAFISCKSFKKTHDSQPNLQP